MTKTICFFTGYYLPHVGGVERYVDKISAELVKRGYKIIIVTSRHDETLEYIERHGAVVIYRLPIKQLFRERYPIPSVNEMYHEIIHDIEQQHIDAIVLNTRFHLTSLVGARLAKRLGITPILIEHGSTHYSVGSKLLDFCGKIYEHILTAFMKRYVKRFFGVSTAATTWLKHYHIQSEGVIRNAIDIKDADTIKETHDGINVTFAGRLIFEKGIREFMAAVDVLLKDSRNTKLEFLVAGDGPMSKIVGEWAKGHSGRVKVLGRLDFQAMKNLYRQTDVFVHPSYTEGLPTAVLEAALFGLAIVATPAGGTMEIIEDGVTGEIIDGSPESIVQAVNKLYKSQELREKLGRAAQSRVKSEFTWQQTTNQLLKFLHF